MAILNKITPCLWFDTDGEAAATFYTGIFDNSRIVQVSHYGWAGPRQEGMVMTVDFVLDGQPFVALNGGADFHFNEAVSFQVSCESQDEVDRLWAALGEGGEQGPCGWLKDRFGVSWQIVPAILDELIRDPDTDRAQRAMQAMLGMGKLDVAELQRAANAADGA
jgi:predicted 3-demethylubiquinone-9 3-methyltransferase (glyoxalase superfamily)